MKNSISNPFHNRSFLISLFGPVILTLILTVIMFRSYTEGFKGFMVVYAWYFAICTTQWWGNGYINHRLDRKYSWKDQQIKRAAYGTVFILVYSGLAYMLANFIMYLLVYGGLPEDFLGWAIRSSFVAILISFSISIVFIAIGFFKSWKASLLEAERFKAEMLMYKYESLQNQINPHFLFNSFNVLSDLVYEDKKKAVDFINQMSQLFRYVLDSRDRELVPISEEIEFISSFAYLLHTRFDNKLSILIDVKAEEEELIVPMALQLLIENSVKHNEISAMHPLKVSVERQNDSIVVVNNLQEKVVEGISTGMGLSNLKEQYKYFTDRNINIVKSEHSYTVEVPIIKSGGQ